MNGEALGEAPPFLILALPRSRTAWLAYWLTYGGWMCGHEQVRYWRSMEDVCSWFSMPRSGTVETGVAAFWRLIPSDVRVITVRRPVAEVVRSAVALGYNARAADYEVRRADAKLDQLEARRMVSRFEFEALATADGARGLWETVLPLPFDEDWYAGLAGVNIQYSAELMARYVLAHEEQLMMLAGEAKRSHGLQRTARIRQKELI